VTELPGGAGLVEALADLEHERWSGWEKYRHLHQSVANEARWKQQRETGYADLSEQEKASDRVEAHRTLALLKTLGALAAMPELTELAWEGL